MNLASDAAAQDAIDLLEAVTAEGIESDRALHLVSGMDSGRTWRALVYVTSVAAGLADSYAAVTGLPVTEVIQIIRSEMTGVNHEH